MLDKSKLKFPLILRKWKQSDYFLSQRFEGKQEIDNILKTRNIPFWKRKPSGCLCSGEDIVWVVGKRADQRFLANAETKRQMVNSLR